MYLPSLLALLFRPKGQQVPAPAPVPAPPKHASFSLPTVDDVKAVQSVLTDCGYLDPPPDGGFGPVSRWALAAFCGRSSTAWTPDAITPAMNAALRNAKPLPLNPGDDLAGRIVRAMQAKGYWIARHPDCVNIVY